MILLKGQCPQRKYPPSKTELRKVWKLVACVVILTVILSGCKVVKKPAATIQPPHPETSPATDAATVPAADAVPDSPTGWEAAKVRFEEILWAGETFFRQDLGQNMTLDKFCQELGSVAEAKVSLSSYSLADLDADGIPELLLGIVFNDELAYGTLVLRYSNNVTGYEFTYRQLMDVKEDGTFRYSGGASDNGIARLRFSNDSWEYNVLGGVENNGEEITYFWDGQQVDQDTYNTYADIHYFKSDIARIPYPCERQTLTFPAFE